MKGILFSTLAPKRAKNANAATAFAFINLARASNTGRKVCVIFFIRSDIVTPSCIKGLPSAPVPAVTSSNCRIVSI